MIRPRYHGAAHRQQRSPGCDWLHGHKAAARRKGRDKREAVSGIISKLPSTRRIPETPTFMAALQSIEGVRVADIVKSGGRSRRLGGLLRVVGYRRPYSGYYALQNLTVRGRAYQVAE